MVDIEIGYLIASQGTSQSTLDIALRDRDGTDGYLVDGIAILLESNGIGSGGC